MPPNKTYPWKEFSDRRLRSKGDTTDDPDWPGLGLDPNTLVLTPGGVAEADTYTWTVTPTKSGVTVPDPVTATGTAADNASTATTFGAAIVTEMADSLADYVESVTVSGSAIYVQIKHDAPEFTETSTPPGAATFTSTPEDTWPITATTSNQRGSHGHEPDALAIAFVPVDSSAEPLADDNSMTFTVQLLRVVERVQRYDVGNQPARTVGVTASVATAAHPVQQEYRIPFHGGRFGVRIHTIANTPTNFDSLEVHWREVIT